MYQVRTETRKQASSRFFVAVVLPVLLLALCLTAFAAHSLRLAAAQADHVSARRQAQEIMLAVNDAVDGVAQSQAGVAIWNPALLEVRKPKPDQTWLDDNIGIWLNFVFNHDADFILSPDDTPIYGMIAGARRVPQSFDRFAGAAAPFIAAVRGRTRLKPNPHERLPGMRLDPASTVRTSPRATHATDLVMLDGRPAAISVMRMIPDTDAVKSVLGREPLLVSIRYLDRGFTQTLAKIQLVAGAHFVGIDHDIAGTQALPLVSSRGQRIGYIAWMPDRPGNAVWHAMAPSAGLALAALLAALGALIFSVAKLTRKDARSLEQLRSAHVELKAREAHAHHLAYHDALTGLPNRAHFNSVVDQLAAASGADDRWAILLVDLDRFKHVNDTLGHLGGDLLIQSVAGRLNALTGDGDVVSRLGGDEFAILLTDPQSDVELAATADAIVAAIRQPFEILDTTIFIGASVGIAGYPLCSRNRSELMRMADIAMYRAKAEGRDKSCFFTTDMDQNVRSRREIERDLREAIANDGEILVYYQPQMDAAGVRITGLEALLRWNHPRKGFLLPQAFVPIAEETGLIRELGRHVLSEACKLARTRPGLSIAVNLSPIQFHSRTFVAEVLEIVATSGARPSQIELEVTESVLLDDHELVTTALKELRSAGFRIALDDFGTGYSSLSYLSKFKVDKIKIDGGFTSRLGQTDDAGAIIHAVVTLGHAMGLSVTAEGVETVAQRQFLAEAGCDQLQGFLFAPALPQAEIEIMVERELSAAA